MKNSIIEWASICESLDEEKRTENFIKQQLISESETSELSNTTEIDEKDDEKKSFSDMTDDEIEAHFEKNAPSYEDIEKLTAKLQDKSEVISKEEYEALSDEDKERLHVAANAPSDITMDDVKKVVRDPQEFLRKHEEFVKDIERRHNTDDWENNKFKYTWVIENEIVYEPSNEIEKDNSPIDSDGMSLADKNEIKYGGYDADDIKSNTSTVFYSKLVPGKYEIENHSEKEFTNLDDAKAYVAKRMREVCDKYNIKFEDFEAIHIKKEQKTGKVDTMVSGLPIEILNKDPEAIGFLYTRTEGDEVEGAKEKKFSKIDRQLFFEYFIYSGNERIIHKDKMDDFAKAFTELALDNNDKTINEETDNYDMLSYYHEKEYVNAMKNLEKLHKKI